jgi:hypothetical protein
MSNRQTVFKVLDSLPKGLYYGWQIESLVHKETIQEHKKPYISTILSYVREYCNISGASFICVDRNKSLYTYEQGYRIYGAILD